MKQVIIMRTQFPSINGVRKGKLIAQGAHASVTAVFDGLSHSNTEDMIKQWIQQGQKKIVVYVKTETDLLELWEKIKKTTLPKALILDAGKTEFGEPTYTAIAIGPGPNNLIDQITNTLPLL